MIVRFNPAWKLHSATVKITSNIGRVSGTRGDAEGRSRVAFASGSVLDTWRTLRGVVGRGLMLA